MKVLFLSNLYPPNVIGGYEELCHEVAREFVRRGHQVSVLASSYGGGVSDIQGQAVYQALRMIVGRTVYEGFSGSQERREQLYAQNAHALARVIERESPEVIFCWNLYGLDRPFYEAVSNCGIPVVAMLTDNWLAAMMNPEFVGAYFRDSVYTQKVPAELSGPREPAFLQPVSVSAIFGSNFMRDFYASSGLSFERDVVIHNGVDLPEETKTYHPRAAAPLGPQVNLLFAGRVVEIKGVHTAVEALGRLVKARPDLSWRLNIVGDTRDSAYIERLKSLAQEQGCADQVVFSGKVRPEDLFGLFLSHDIYLFPSLYEPFSLTLIHALASGIPTVASTAGGNVEIVEDGKTGLLFPTADAEALSRAVLRLVDEPELRLRVSKGGWSVSRAFSSQRMFDQMEAHLASVKR